jgi:predicted alpha/beta-hydrolase family hydrolase
LTSSPAFLIDGPTKAATTLVLAHGAGAGMHTPFLNAFATGLAGRGIRVVRFEFPYMAALRATGKRTPPDREPVLRESWLRVIGQVGRDGLFIGGKSMGGRLASMVADEAGAAGLVCLGYPFHPVGIPQRLRVKHLQTITTPTLICQGTRDPFGGRDEVLSYPLAPAIGIHWLEDGDHDFKPRKASGRTQQQNWEEAMAEVARFLSGKH